MASISLNRVGILFPTALFQNLTIVIGETDRIGLIAGNGGGKSTLLRCLDGQAEPGEGTIVRARGLRLAHVQQDVPVTLMDLPLEEAVRRALPPGERDDNAWRVDVVLDEFETPAELRARPIRALSGGWQRLALIARAWVTEPDCLLLDEPTNHLDLGKIQLLERWICAPERRIAMVIASHDRRFLDTVTTRTLFLRPDISRSYAHPYSRSRQLLAEDEAAQASKLARDTKEVERLRRSAGELRNIGINSRSDAAQRKSMLMADRAETLEQRLKPLHVERSGEIRLGNRGTHARVLVSIDDVTVRRPDGAALFRTGRLRVFQGDRIVVLGENGVGKSQLMGLLRRAILSGDVSGVQPSPSLVLGYADQMMSQLPEQDTPIGFITGLFRLGDQRSRSLLAGAGFPVDRQLQTIATLSPGQKSRLGLLALRLAEPNFYLLDEPTNHVDIAGQEKLEAEILAHEATCILVSHDRSFVAAVASRFWRIERGALVETEAA